MAFRATMRERTRSGPLDPAAAGPSRTRERAKSSKPVRPGSPRLGRFDSCAAPLEETPADPKFTRIRILVPRRGFLSEIWRKAPLQAFLTIAQSIARLREGSSVSAVPLCLRV